MQQKLPLTNGFLKAVAAIHPEASGHTITLKYLQQLPTFIPNVFTEAEVDLYEREIRKFQTDTLPEITGRIDNWWGMEAITKSYPSMSRMVQSVLSCFHGPQVESSFNTMNDIIDAKSGRINIETYNSIQTIKYELTASGQTAVQYFKKDDFLHQKINPSLCRDMTTAHRQYKTILLKKKAASEDQKQLLQVEQAQKIVTKRKAKEISVKAAKKARLSHQQKIVSKK